MNKHMNYGGALILILAFAGAPFNALAQTKPIAKTSAGLVFEVVREGWANTRVGANILRLYKSGRVIFVETRGKRGEEKLRTVKTATSRVDAQKVSELVELANRPDFLDAKDRYNKYSAGVDGGNRGKVTYFHKGGKKTIELAPYHRRQNQAEERLPESLEEFLKKVSAIEDLMEGKLSN